ncbi:phosphotransferase [Sphingosinicella rhizophila]|uniref:Phosphotransferase n=1 Tax=Sphingosinicella rhizophila TaxID=3050082 RepID=A0ABU3QD68_9SPHN|nr:phosphotransferase [Sphingosinicella sp. GR2756]MDT9601084.1 phosphotransferase [Sphingosinicella sp. GR2756]
MKNRAIRMGVLVHRLDLWLARRQASGRVFEQTGLWKHPLNLAAGHRPVISLGDRLMENPSLDAIRQAFAHEQLDRPLARKASDIPVSYEAITPDWLTAVICHGQSGAKVTSFDLGEPDSGSSNRRRIFLNYNSEEHAAGLPQSIFCKAAHDLVTRILCSSGMTHSEVTFYNKIRPQLDIEAPTAFLAQYDPVAFKSIIILKDIADEVTFCSHETKVDFDMAKGQLDLLARMHGHFYRSVQFEFELKDVQTFHGRFMNLCDNHCLAECCDNGFVAARDVLPAAVFARHTEVWPATLLAVNRDRNQPETLTHGDVHLKNWYVTHAGQVGLGDWQVTCRGHWSRDLAYAISTALEPVDRRAWETDLIQFYIERLGANGGPRIGFEEALLHYRQQMLTVLAWWTVTLSPSQDMPDMQPANTTMTFLARIGQAIDDWESLDSFDQI